MIQLPSDSRRGRHASQHTIGVCLQGSAAVSALAQRQLQHQKWTARAPWEFMVTNKHGNATTQLQSHARAPGQPNVTHNTAVAQATNNGARPHQHCVNGIIFTTAAAPALLRASARIAARLAGAPGTCIPHTHAGEPLNTPASRKQRRRQWQCGLTNPHTMPVHTLPPAVGVTTCCCCGTACCRWCWGCSARGCPGCWRPPAVCTCARRRWRRRTRRCSTDSRARAMRNQMAHMMNTMSGSRMSAPAGVALRQLRP